MISIKPWEYCKEKRNRFLKHIIVESEKKIDKATLEIGGQQISELTNIDPGVSFLKFWESPGGSLGIPIFAIYFHEIKVIYQSEGDVKFRFVYYPATPSEMKKYSSPPPQYPPAVFIPIKLPNISSHISRHMDPDNVTKGYNNVLVYQGGMCGLKYST